MLTFKSTTATFKTEKMLNDNKNRTTYSKKDIVNIPAKLTDTCFGIGLEIICTDMEIRNIYYMLQKEKIDYKHIWHDVNEDGNYIIIDNNLRKGAKKINE